MHTIELIKAIPGEALFLAQQMRKIPQLSREVRGLRETFKGKQWVYEAFSLISVSFLSDMWERTGNERLSPLIVDAPAGAGSSTLLNNMVADFGYTQFPMGKGFRTFGLAGRSNNYTEQEIIDAAKSDQLHFKINRTGDGMQFEATSTVADKQFSVTVDEDERDLYDAANGVYASNLNGDETYSVEGVLVDAVAPFLWAGEQFVVEGRNMAERINRGKPKKDWVPAAYLGVSEKTSLARAELRCKLNTRKKKNREATPEELAAVREETSGRNARDKKNGILMSAVDAYHSDYYRLLINADKIGPRRVELAVICLHGAFFELRRLNKIHNNLYFSAIEMMIIEMIAQRNSKNQALAYFPLDSDLRKPVDTEQLSQLI